MNKSFKELATTTCVEAITSSSKNLVEVIATSLTALHKAQGINTPLKFSAADAKRIAFDARVKFNKAKGVPSPSKIDYDQSSKGPNTSFRSRHLELTKIIENVQHYAEAKTTCDELVKVGTFKQAGASEIVRAMHAIGKGDTVDTFKTAQIKAKTERDAKAVKADADAATPAGFDKALKKLIDAAAKLDFHLTATPGAFEHIEPEPVVDPADQAEAMPEAAPIVLDQEALAAMMNMPQFQQAVQMAAFAVANAKK